MNDSQIKRLQGTDGVRGRVAPSSGLSGSPLEVFLNNDLITEEFFELYCYAHVSDLIERGKAQKGGRFLIGWDSRDTKNFYTGAAVRGISKAGGVPVVLETIPTPGVALSLVSMEAAGAFMITASHNPKDQNGIKIFLAPDAMKMLPKDDEALTKKIVETDYEEVKKQSPMFEPLNLKNDAAELFKKFHLDPLNNWVEDKNLFAKTVLIVDPAHGAMAGIAKEVFAELGFEEVIEVAGEQNGNVNENSGVADLEGIKEISWYDMREQSALSKHTLVTHLFAYGQGVKEKIVKSELFLAGVTFDADGDRFYILVYEPGPQSGEDFIHVLSGDECAALQAGYLMETDPEKYRGRMFVHTVESDINVARRIRLLGMNPVVEAVGDKWILKIAMENGEDFGIGVEESGHSITRGVVRTKTAKRGFYAGNGLKGAINTLTAIHSLKIKTSAEEFIKSVKTPFEPGYKSTLYSYYVKKELFTRDSGIWNGVLKTIEAVFAPEADGLLLVPREIENEPDMLYLGIEKGGEGRIASVFIRNSGTEDKIGVNARGPHELQNLLDAITAEAVVYLTREMKDEKNDMAIMEKAVLKAAESGEKIGKNISSGVNFNRLLHEMEMKEKLIKSGDGGFYLTELGRRIVK